MNKLRHQLIRLSSTEWGSDTMARVATLRLKADKPTEESGPLLITVNEHAGWHLEFGLLAGAVKVVGSANDRAVYPDDVQQLRLNLIKCRNWEYLPEIDRNEGRVTFASLAPGDLFDFEGWRHLKNGVGSDIALREDGEVRSFPSDAGVLPLKPE